MTNHNFDKEISFVLAGEAGQGIDTITHIIAKVLKLGGFNVFYTLEYMSRIKGGCNSSSIRVSGRKVCAYCERADFVFAMSKGAIKHLEKRISQGTFILYEYDNSELLDKFENKTKVDFSVMAKEFGESIYANTIISGIIMGILNIDLKLLQEYLKQTFSGKDNEIVEKNLQASAKGYEIGTNLVREKNILINIPKDESIKNEIFLNGNDAVALGCIAGGVDFISSYPMSPSTGILTFMAKHSSEFNILVEQAEDEIAAINMGLGAWYAGSRAMTTTSGGGFALMTEAVSLSGMTEMPMVIYLGQRPGPATGLPTRTEQGDLNLALYSGHGEFPRIILTPGTLEDAFYLAQKAFNLADKFQVPVFILSDQYFADSCYGTKSFDMGKVEIEEFIEKTVKDYKRYALTENGISPRGIPNLGEGLVVVDSDEHDEEGHITEDHDVRIQMVNKRMAKFDLIKKDSFLPEFFGNADASNLVIGWGSTCNAIKEALDEINNPDVAFLYFKQVYPLNIEILEHFKNTKGAKKIICIETNFTGQFANLLKLELDVNVDEKILKYNGLTFSVEELVLKINEVIKNE